MESILFFHLDFYIFSDTGNFLHFFKHPRCSSKLFHNKYIGSLKVSTSSLEISTTLYYLIFLFILQGALFKLEKNKRGFRGSIKWCYLLLVLSLRVIIGGDQGTLCSSGNQSMVSYEKDNCPSYCTIFWPPKLLVSNDLSSSLKPFSSNYTTFPLYFRFTPVWNAHKPPTLVCAISSHLRLIFFLFYSSSLCMFVSICISLSFTHTCTHILTNSP